MVNEEDVNLWKIAVRVLAVWWVIISSLVVWVEFR